MRRLPLPLLLCAVLLTGCATDGGATAEDGGDAEASATASPAPPPDIEGLVVETEELAKTHKEGPLDYDRVPPVGGDHNPRWLACDVYDEPVPNEVAVHSLEHGAVWFAYDPELPESEVRRLGRLADRNQEYVLVSPVRGLDARVVAVAWGASLEASSADDPRLGQFLDAYAGGAQGGEPGAPCRGGGLTLREARGQVGTEA